MPPALPPSPQAAPTPVFVDDTGRRHRLVRLIGWTAGGLTLAYLALLGVSLIGSPGLVPLSLPAIGRVLPDSSAPHIGAATKFVRGGPDQSVIVEQSPAPGAPTFGGTDLTGRPAPAGRRGSATPAPPRVPAPAGRRVTATPAPRLTPPPAPSASASSPAHAPQGNPSPAGTSRASHTPGPHPSANNGNGTPPNVRGSPTPSPT